MGPMAGSERELLWLRRVRDLSHLLATEREIDVLAQEREEAIMQAAENLSACLLNEETRDLLNDWMIDDPAQFN